MNIIYRLFSRGVRIIAPDARNEKKAVFAGKSIVITGALSGMTRREAKELIEKNGGRLSSSVSRLTDYLVIGSNPGSKLSRAKKLDVPVIDEDALKRLISK